MGARSRNAPCPCGSGRKYKRCCLEIEQRDRAAARFEGAVGERIRAWATTELPIEIKTASEEFAGPEPVFNERDYQIFIQWFCSDRQLAEGGTPAERYAARADIDPRERDVAARIAAARLSLQRVHAVEAGRWIELEDVLDGSVVRVRSGEVSREVARWDVLLCRVMADEWMPSLWGPVLLHSPDEEPELIAELERLADENAIPAGRGRLARVFHVAPLELLRFVPANRKVERSFYTAEGDPIANGRATWRVADAVVAFERLDSPPELTWVGESEDGWGETFQWTVDRAEAVAGRLPLPPGALCFESSLTELPGRICLATFVLTEEELLGTAISEPRLDAAIGLVRERLGGCAELRERAVEPFEPDPLGKRGDAPRRRTPPPGLTAAEARALELELLDDHLRRWLDQPLEPLGGLTPREAARGVKRGEVELLLRGIENHAERARRDGTPWPEVDWLRVELGLGTDQLAA